MDNWGKITQLINILFCGYRRLEIHTNVSRNLYSSGAQVPQRVIIKHILIRKNINNYKKKINKLTDSVKYDFSDLQTANYKNAWQHMGIP